MQLEPYDIYAERDYSGISTLLDLVIESHPNEIRYYLSQYNYSGNTSQDMKLNLLELIDTQGDVIISEILPYVPYYDLITEEALKQHINISHPSVTSAELDTTQNLTVRPRPQNVEPYSLSYLMSGQITLFQILMMLMIVYILIKIVKSNS